MRDADETIVYMAATTYVALIIFQIPVVIIQLSAKASTTLSYNISLLVYAIMWPLISLCGWFFQGILILWGVFDSISQLVSIPSTGPILPLAVVASLAGLVSAVFVAILPSSLENMWRWHAMTRVNNHLIHPVAQEMTVRIETAVPRIETAEPRIETVDYVAVIHPDSHIGVAKVPSASVSSLAEQRRC